MIVHGGTSFLRALRLVLLRNWLAALIVVSLTVFYGELATVFEGLKSNVFNGEAVGMLATVVGIFLVFRFNEAYARWWEARDLWGRMVNASRSFARQVTTLLTSDRVAGLGGTDAAQKLQRELVYRQIAFANAMRLSLRRQSSWEELRPFLSNGELESYRDVANVPAQLMRKQGAEIAALLTKDTAETLVLSQLDDTLTELTSIQGGCERIKGTTFPDSVTYITGALVWGIVLLLPLAFLDHTLLEQPQLPSADPIYPLEIVWILFISLSFPVVHQLGTDLKNPFENQRNDTPMSALCRTIEIDLLQMLGESETPRPLEPVDGILM